MKLSMFDLTGCVAMVTGGSQGIGFAMAEALASVGSDIIIVNRDFKKGKTAAEKIKDYGVKTISIPGDVCIKKSVEDVVANALNRFEKIDILVNGAGIMLRRPAIDIEEEDWDKVMSINLKGVYLCSKMVGKQMIERRKGKIINVSSIYSVSAVSERSAYCVSKAGVSHLTKTLALEWANYNINVNAIAPGITGTDHVLDFFKSNPTDYKKFLSRIPMGRIANTEDLSGITILLASKASDYITGQTIFVDGGWTVL